MSKFRVTYPSGAVEETEQSDCDTLEQFVNVKFGSADYASNGVVVEHIQCAVCDASLLAVVEEARVECMADQSMVDALIASVEDGSDMPAMSVALDMQPFVEALSETKPKKKK